MRLFTIFAALLMLSAPACSQSSAEEEDEGPLSAATFEGMALRNIGPAFMSGRIADIAIVPDDPATWYVAVGSGGVWKTVNADIPHLIARLEPLEPHEGLSES